MPAGRHRFAVAAVTRRARDRGNRNAFFGEE